MLEEFLALFMQAQKRFMLDDGSPLVIGSSRKGPLKGEPTNEIVTLSWVDADGNVRESVLREADIASGGYNPETRTFEFFDKRRQPVSIRLNHFDDALQPQEQAARPAQQAFPITMVEEFRRVCQLGLPGGLFVVAGDEAHPVVSSELNAPAGLPGNYLLVARCHGEPGDRLVVVVTEEGVEAGQFNSERQVFEFLDRIGQPVAIQVRKEGSVVVPEILKSPHEKKPETVFVVIQEGGSSNELYLHEHDSQAAANEHRLVCWDDGAYKTSPVVEVPASLAEHPDFASVAEKLLVASRKLAPVGALE
ncbi:hypothetical protein G3A43_07175 [Paraburkholderia aspalathi]|nr:hypothetical protein [Paraburkholderia aspalathi]MBK3780034.1 hypothetical protein [Paraburkholderia aspalathi]